MKRSGFVITLIGIAIGLIPTVYYTASAFGTSNYDAGTAKVMTVLDLASGILSLIGFVVIVATLPRVVPGQQFPPGPAGYPPTGYPQGGYPPAGSPQGGYPQGFTKPGPR